MVVLSADIPAPCAHSCSLALLQLPLREPHAGSYHTWQLRAGQALTPRNLTDPAALAPLQPQNSISLGQLAPDSAWELHTRCADGCRPAGAVWRLEAMEAPPPQRTSPDSVLLIPDWLLVEHRQMQAAPPTPGADDDLAPPVTRGLGTSKNLLQGVLLVAALLAPAIGSRLGACQRP